MLDNYTQEAYTILTDRRFLPITLQALYKGYEAVGKMLRKEMPNGLLTISCKQDYNKVNWIALSLALEKFFKDKGMWSPPTPGEKQGTVKVNRVVV